MEEDHSSLDRALSEATLGIHRSRIRAAIFAILLAKFGSNEEHQPNLDQAPLGGNLDQRVFSHEHSQNVNEASDVTRFKFAVARFIIQNSDVMPDEWIEWAYKFYREN